MLNNNNFSVIVPVRRPAISENKERGASACITIAVLLYAVVLSTESSENTSKTISPSLTQPSHVLNPRQTMNNEH